MAPENSPKSEKWGKVCPTVRVLSCFVEKRGLHCVKSPNNHFWGAFGGVGWGCIEQHARGKLGGDNLVTMPTASLPSSVLGPLSFVWLTKCTPLRVCVMCPSRSTGFLGGSGCPPLGSQMTLNNYKQSKPADIGISVEPGQGSRVWRGALLLITKMGQR